jgi:hypothetical protein
LYPAMTGVKAAPFGYVSGSAMALLGLFAVLTVVTWPSPLGARNSITIVLALLVAAELSMVPVGLWLFARLPRPASPFAMVGLVALAASLTALTLLVWAYLTQSDPPSPRLLELALGGGAGVWLLLTNQLARLFGVLKGPLPWVGSLAGAIWLLDPLNGFHMIAETTSVLGFLLYAAWATGLARAR